MGLMKRTIQGEEAEKIIGSLYEYSKRAGLAQDHLSLVCEPALAEGLGHIYVYHFLDSTILATTDPNPNIEIISDHLRSNDTYKELEKITGVKF